MDPVSQANRLAQVLRQRLLERAKAGGAGKAQAGRSGAGQAAPDPLHELARSDDASEHQLHRALVQDILTDQFGAKAVNEAKFQQVVGRVTEALEQEPEAARLLARIAADVRAAARR